MSRLQTLPAPDQTQPPFVPPAGATFNSGLVSPSDYNLYCLQAATGALLAQYNQAARKQRFQVLSPLVIVDGIKDGEYGEFAPSPSGATILLIQGSLGDSAGNSSKINDVAGRMLWRYQNPFVPGQTNYGDTNYKEVIPELATGVPDPADTADVAVPGFLVLAVVAQGLVAAHWAALPAA